MANVKISALPNLANLASGTQFPVANAGNTFSVTSDTIKAYVVGTGFSVGNSIISNVATPIASTDAATKGYVDSATSSGFTVQDDTANTTVVSGGDTLQLYGTANEVTVAITTTDQVTFGLPDSVTITGNLGAGNVSGTNITGTLSTASQTNITSVGTLGSLSVTGNVSAGNLSGTNIAGTLTTASQTNITSVGTLGSLSVTGNITGGNLSINTDAIITGNLTVNGTTTTINSNTITTNDLNITVGNNQSTGAALNNAGLDVGSNNLATWRFNNATTSWQSNIAVMPTANGTLTLGGASNYWGAAYVTTLAATGNANVGNIGATAVVATNLTGTLQTAAQTNITSVGTLGSLTVTGNVSTGNVSGTTGTFTNVAGTLSTAAQTNVTSVGTLTGLTINNATIAITNGAANGSGNIGSSSGVFNTVFAKATSAQYADLAEKYTADADYAPGTVVKFGGSAEITVCDHDHDPEIAGVVSTNPAHIMNAGLQGDHVTAVALTGRVPCHVQGPVRRGQMLVSAGNGRARAETHPGMGTVIGKALEDFNGDIGTIEAVVGRL